MSEILTILNSHTKIFSIYIYVPTFSLLFLYENNSDHSISIEWHFVLDPTIYSLLFLQMSMIIGSFSLALFEYIDVAFFRLFFYLIILLTLI